MWFWNLAVAGALGRFSVSVAWRCMGGIQVQAVVDNFVVVFGVEIVLKIPWAAISISRTFSQLFHPIP